MNLEILISKNLLIGGEVGSGKTYLLTLLIKKIIENKDSSSLIYISDPKLFCFRRFINNKDILNYDENELVKIVNDRLEKLKDNPEYEFSDIYVLFDEIGNELFFVDNVSEEVVNGKRKFADAFIDLIASKLSKKIKVYILAATQLPHLFLPKEIQSKFDYFVELEPQRVEGFIPLLSKELKNSFIKVLSDSFDERNLTLYKILEEDNEQL